MPEQRRAPAVVAEFESLDDLRAAARLCRDAGVSILDALTPFPDDEVADIIGVPPSRLPLAILLGGVCGAAGGYLLQWYTAAVSFPVNVGGRPLNSWPAFVVPCFELTILFGALTGFFGFLIACALPMPHHPLFALPAFDRASRDRFFLYIEGEHAARVLAGLPTLGVFDVPR